MSSTSLLYTTQKTPAELCSEVSACKHTNTVTHKHRTAQSVTSSSLNEVRGEERRVTFPSRWQWRQLLQSRWSSIITGERGLCGAAVHENWVRNEVKLKWLSDARCRAIALIQFKCSHYYLRRLWQAGNDNGLTDEQGSNAHTNPHAAHVCEHNKGASLRFTHSSTRFSRAICLALRQFAAFRQNSIHTSSNSSIHAHKHIKPLWWKRCSSTNPD